MVFLSQHRYIKSVNNKMKITFTEPSINMSKIPNQAFEIPPPPQKKKKKKKEKKSGRIFVVVVSCCFEPTQPQRIISGLTEEN